MRPGWDRRCRHAHGQDVQLAGIVCLIVGVSLLMLGSSGGPPWSSLVLGGVGAVLLIVGLVRGRDAPAPAAVDRVERRRRLARITLIGLGAMGLLALLVALVVAEGGARGHAFVHLLTGTLSLGLFAVLALAWRPREGRAASLQGFVLLLLAVATAAQFVESVGGSGYDAANAGRRIEELTTLHGVGVAFGGIVLVAVPLGLLTAAGVLIAAVTRRARELRT